MCGNCESSTTSDQDLVLTRGGVEVARLCAPCQETVLLAKVVLRRNTGADAWVFEQYLPVKLGT